MPWRNLIREAGRVYSLNGFPPWSRIHSHLASATGWVGFSKGRRVTMTWERAGPGMSTPVQKLSVPKRTAFWACLKRRVVSVRENSAPWRKRGRSSLARAGATRVAVFWRSL